MITSAELVGAPTRKKIGYRGSVEVPVRVCTPGLPPRDLEDEDVHLKRAETYIPLILNNSRSPNFIHIHINRS
jgi:hypothetical protein